MVDKLKVGKWYLYYDQTIDFIEKIHPSGFIDIWSFELDDPCHEFEDGLRPDGDEYSEVPKLLTILYGLKDGFPDGC